MSDDEECNTSDPEYKRLTKLRNIIKILKKYAVFDTHGQPNECTGLPLKLMTEDECCMTVVHDALEEPPEDVWLGHFNGYRCLTANIENNLNDFKKCIVLQDDVCDESLQELLRAGINCFIIDLFLDSFVGNRQRIEHLRNCEKKIETDLGFPISSTIIARLTPRLQYTGLVENSMVEIVENEKIILTTNRFWCKRGNKRRIFVNARYMLVKLKECDIILIGQTIQVKILSIVDLDLHCLVLRGGQITSRMPVRVPGKCQVFHLSVEELEDIQLCKKMNINILVSYIPGSAAYVDDFRDCLTILKCDRMHFYARVILNEMQNCDKEIDWIVDKYDGFIMEIKMEHMERSSEILEICPGAECIIQSAFEMKKPLLLEPNGILDKRILVPSNYIHYIFFCPEKYIFTCSTLSRSFYFFLLQNVHASRIPTNCVTQFPFLNEFCGESDKLAHNCAATANELQPRAIFVCSPNGLMAMKISHFRPIVPIILISSSECIGSYVSLHHNVTMLLYPKNDEHDYFVELIKQLAYGLKFANAKRMLHHNDSVFLVYGTTAPGTKLQENYVMYTYKDGVNCEEHLQEVIKNSIESAAKLNFISHG